MSEIQDRPYQREFVDGNDIHPGVFPSWQAGDTAVLGLLPTGCGKTVCAGMIASKVKEEFGRRTLVLAGRQELVYQAAGTIERFDLSVGIEMGDQKVDSISPLFGRPDVCVATVQTLQGRRLLKRSKSEFGAIITDECHHGLADSYRRIYDYFDDYWHLGITATADRGDGRNLGRVFPKIAFEYSLRSAINDGWLVPILTAKMPCGVDLKDIKTTGGDYSQSELEERIGPHVESLCDIILKEMGDRQTIIFTPDVGSAEAAASALDQMGVRAEAVSGRMSKEERKRVLDAYQACEFQVIVCCDLLIEGWDCPPASCVVIMRPTKQRNRYVQMVGRGTRPCPARGKTDVLVIDFAWETTSDHELVTAIELFDDSDGLDDEVSQIAAGLLASGAERDPMKAIDQAEEIHRNRTTFKIKLTGKRTPYKKVVYDPVGVGSIIGVPIKKGWDFNPMKPATERQLESLRSFGIQNPEGLSTTGAGKMLGALKKRKEQNLGSIRQVEYMVSLGVDIKQARQMTFEDAQQTLSTLTSRKAG